jgi:hypothetical protein
MTEVENGVRRALCPAILEGDACCPTPRGNQANSQLKSFGVFALTKRILPPSSQPLVDSTARPAIALSRQPETKRGELPVFPLGLAPPSLFPLSHSAPPYFLSKTTTLA